MLDVIVVGGGPAALSAALNLKIRNKSFLILGGNEKVTGLIKAPQVDNYLGFMEISGSELLEGFKRHAEHMGIELKREKAYNILNMGDYFAVNAGNEFYDARSIIIATGHGKANYLNGEREYLGRGIGYCATCDGPLYKGKPIAIISENEEGEEEANFLSEICSQVFYLPVYSSQPKLKDGVKLIRERVRSIEGDGNKVNKLVTEQSEIEVSAVFIIRNVIPVGQLIDGLTIEEGSIRVDRSMATNIRGVYACGDCTGKPYQIAKAVGEGNVAALSAVKYLDGISVE